MTEIAESPVTADTATATAAAGDSVRGRSCFCVETTGAGLAVHTAFAAEDGRVMPMPAVFPDVHYALEQIDTLRRIVVDRFAEAARVGAQVIAEQLARAGQPAAMPAAEPVDAASNVSQDAQDGVAAS